MVAVVNQQLLDQAFAAEERLSSSMSRWEMRSLGLTVLNIRRRARQMARDGELSPQMTEDQIVSTVVDDLVSSAGTERFAAVNWPAIMEFIKALLPLILQIIAMF